MVAVELLYFEGDQVLGLLAAFGHEEVEQLLAFVGLEGVQQLQAGQLETDALLGLVQVYLGG